MTALSAFLVTSEHPHPKKRILDELARCFLPDILAFYETPEGREEYEEWKLTQTQQTPQNAPQPP